MSYFPTASGIIGIKSDPETGERTAEVRTDLDVLGSITQNGESIAGAGGAVYEIPSEAPDGVEDTFTFSAPPKLVFRNGVMELRFGSVAGNAFVFSNPPREGDNIEGLV